MQKYLEVKQLTLKNNVINLLTFNLHNKMKIIKKGSDDLQWEQCKKKLSEKLMKMCHVTRVREVELGPLITTLYFILPGNFVILQKY